MRSTPPHCCDRCGGVTFTETLQAEPQRRYRLKTDLAQALLDSLPDGCELRTSIADIGRGCEATAQIIHTTDTPLGRITRDA